MTSFTFTCGDINGIGPEIAVKTLARILSKETSRFIIIIPENVFDFYASSISFKYKYDVVKKISDIKTSSEQCIILSQGKANIQIGKPTRTSGKISYNAIMASIGLLKSKEADAVVTAPISKTALKLAGINFPGHTEIYAGAFGVKNYAMTFLSKSLICSLATIHEPLNKVPKLLKLGLLIKNFDLTYETLYYDWNIKNPQIAVLGLNPHAGENGYIGNEEIEVITPAMKKSKYPDSLFGPFSPDAYFANKAYKNYNATIGMYHDQVLIPFKMLNFNSGVNYTTGLPVIRTSPDHGTAYDIAGLNKADHNSFYEAFLASKKIVKNRKRKEGSYGRSL